jgi:hypothetical protein
VSDKPVAGFVTLIVAAPLVLLCCLGPVVLIGLLAGTAGWFAGLGLMAIAGSAALAGYVAFRQYRRASRGGHMVNQKEIEQNE